MADLALALFGAALVAWVIGEAALTSHDRPAPGTLAVPTGLLVFASHVGGVIEHVSRGGSPTWAIAAGTALFAGGLGLRLWSIAALGAGFVTALDSPRLVTTGPYRWMRHPSEVGLLAAMLGGSALLASRFALAAAIALVPIAVVRCRREDTALARRHPTAHAAWATRVGWISPRRTGAGRYLAGSSTGS